MTTIRRFEDIQAWQEARSLVKQIYALTEVGAFSKDYGLRDQLRRASVSVMANIAEGFDCDSNLEFARFLGIARRSAVEVQSLLYAALDVRYINQETFQACYEQANKVKAFVSAFKSSLKNALSFHTPYIARRTSHLLYAYHLLHPRLYNPRSSLPLKACTDGAPDLLPSIGAARALPGGSPSTAADRTHQLGRWKTASELARWPRLDG